MAFSARAFIAAGLGLLGIAGTITLAQPAAAAAPTCPYPYVCFYDTYELNSPTAKMTGKYQVVTSGWQWFTGSTWGSLYMVNTRNDDVAYVHMTDGTTRCVENNSSYDFDNDRPVRVDAVRISWAANC